VTALLIIGIIAVLMSNGGASDQSVLGSVISEATLDEAFLPAVRVSWSPNGFAKGNSQRAQWQIFRSDIVDSPVLNFYSILNMDLALQKHFGDACEDHNASPKGN
jgi:hypothetical protein